MLKRPLQTFFQKNSLLLLLLFGIVVWSVTMVKSGIVYGFGMGFWGPNGHDGIWHVAVINSLSKGIFSMPVFAGENIKNYHIGFDLLLSGIHRITNIPVIALYFQIIPPIFAALIGFLVYRFVLLWKGSSRQAIWATFFVYFSGSLGWVVTFIKDGTFAGESLFWAQQSLSTLINPPFALSLIFIFLGLIFLEKYLKSGSNKFALYAIIVFSLTIQVKVYAGVLIIAGLFFAGVTDLLIRRNLKFLYIFLATLVLSVFAILPTYDFGTKSLVFAPFWFLESMVASPDRFYWPKMATALINYKLSGNIIKAILAYSFTFFIFLLGNLGVRIIAVPWISKGLRNFRKLGIIEIILISTIFVGILIPLCFVQAGNPWNSIQFFYYSLVFLSVLSGVSVGEYFERIRKENKSSENEYSAKVWTATAVLLILIIPTLVSTLRNYLPSRPPAKISIEELQALKFLKDMPDGVVLTQLYDRELADKAIANPPRPLYLYESTAYVAALSGKQTFLEDEVNLEITGYDWKRRREDIIRNFGDTTYLKNLGITYIYIPDEESFKYKDEMKSINIYNKDNIAIYKL
jgi:hypothetical protein